MNNNTWEYKKYTIEWLEVSKEFLIWQVFPNESNYIKLPFIKCENVYYASYKWKNYYCNEWSISKFKILFDSESIRWLPDWVLLTENDLMLGILLSNLSEVENFNETLYFTSLFIDRYFFVSWNNRVEWGKIMFSTIALLYWYNASIIFYKNSNLLVEKFELSPDEIFEEMSEMFRKKISKI